MFDPNITKRIRDADGVVVDEYPLKLKDIPRRQVMSWHLNQTLFRDLMMNKNKVVYAPNAVLSD